MIVFDIEMMRYVCVYVYRESVVFDCSYKEENVMMTSSSKYKTGM